jgi:hypothetical protein
MTTGDMDRPGDPDRPGAVDEAIWSELVAAFHEPSAPDERPPWPRAENLAAAPQSGEVIAAEPFHGEPGAEAPDAPLGPAGEAGGDRDGGPPSRVVRPAVRTDAPQLPPAAVTWTGPVAPPSGPRDWPAPTVDEDSIDGYVPPPIPPMELGGAAKAAWLAGIGGPLYLMAAAIVNWPTPRWAAALCLLGGIGGFGYLVSRLKDRQDDSDEDPDDPTYGAVV